MANTTVACTNINLLKESQIPASPSQNELYAVEIPSPHCSLLDFKWTDHIINDMSWVRADTFSWLDGTIYQSVYELLLEEFSNGETHTDTIGGITVDYRLSPNGFKIVNGKSSDDVSAVEQLYNQTGVAWYYILHREATRFKLPRTKYGFVGLRDVVGNYVPESLPNHKHWFIKNAINGPNSDNIPDGYNKPATKNQNYGNNWNYAIGYTDGEANTLNTGAVSENSTYQDNAPVQQRATQMYLYFYVGEYSQSAIEQTAGITSEQLNQKQDLLTGVSGGGDYVVEWKTPTAEDPTWYRLYKSGWVEQGGVIIGSNIYEHPITFIKSYANTNYSIITTCDKNVADNAPMFIEPMANTKTTAGVVFRLFWTGGVVSEKGYWEVKGMSAQGNNS